MFQLQLPDGDWLDMATHAEDVIVLCGTMMEIMTGGVLKAPVSLDTAIQQT